MADCLDNDVIARWQIGEISWQPTTALCPFGRKELQPPRSECRQKYDIRTEMIQICLYRVPPVQA